MQQQQHQPRSTSSKARHFKIILKAAVRENYVAAIRTFKYRFLLISLDKIFLLFQNFFPMSVIIIVLSKHTCFSYNIIMMSQ